MPYIWDEFMNEFLAGKLKGEPYENLKTTDIRGMLKAFWYYLKNRGDLK